MGRGRFVEEPYRPCDPDIGSCAPGEMFVFSHNDEVDADAMVEWAIGKQNFAAQQRDEMLLIAGFATVTAGVVARPKPDLP